MRFWTILILLFCSVVAFGIGSDYRELRPEVYFPEQIGLGRRDESSGATVAALSTAQSFVKLTSTVTTIQGAVAPPSPVSRMLIISNYTGSPVAIVNQSGSASAANRFSLIGGVDSSIPDKGSATFLYDHGLGRWVVAGGGSTPSADFTPGTGLEISSGTGTGAVLKNFTLGIASGYYLPTTSDQTSWDQAAIDATQALSDAAAAQSDIDDHIADTTAAHAASAVSNTPAGNLAATNVQTALNELQSDVDTRLKLISLSATAPIDYDNTTGVFSCEVASGSQAGCLAASKFSDFQGAVNDTTNATDAATAGQLVRRDGSADFAAHNITVNKIIGALQGNADTATALAANPSDCSADNYATSIAANGNLSCSTVSDAGLAESYIKADGTRELSADWDVGAHSITADAFIGAISGNADTATALASDPSDCGANSYATSIDASGNLTCSTVSDSGLTSSYIKADGSRGLSADWNAGAHNITASTFIGALQGNADSCTALASNPTDCGANNYATAIDANGNLTCGTVSDSGLAVSYVKADGSRGLSANWNAGAHNITASTFIGALQGNADTATALAANPSDCSADNYATAIAANGNLTCGTISDAGLALSYLKADGSRPLSSNWNAGSFNITASTFIGALTGNADTATALAANPSDCSANNYATAIAANGNLTCGTVSDAGLAISYLKADGSRPLTSNWNAGSFNITATTFIGALTGVASGNMSIASPVNHGVVLSGSGNATTASTAGSTGQAFRSGGASADGSYSADGYLNIKGTDIASASTTDLSTATGDYVDVTGTTTITSFGTMNAGVRRFVRFKGALTLTHNSTSLILPGSANITTANGDMAICVSLGSGNWQCMYAKADGTAVVSSGGGGGSGKYASVVLSGGTEPSDCTSSPCTLNRQFSSTGSNAFSSATRGGTGGYTFNFTGGYWSHVFCVAVGYGSGAPRLPYSTVAISTSSWVIGTRDPNSLIDSGVMVLCMGD